MAAATEHSLALVVKAVDKATGPLRAMTAKLNAIMAPARAMGHEWEKFSKAAGLEKLGEKFGEVGHAAREVGHEVLELGLKFAELALGGGIFGELVRKSAELDAALEANADRVGLTVDSYASLRFAAGQSEVGQEEFTSALDKFTKGLGEAKAGGGKMLTFLNQVSPALAKEVLHAKSTEEAFSLMTDAFKRINDPAKSAALSAAVFGKSSLQMGRFLNKGSTEIQALQVEYMRLHGSQQEASERAGELNRAFKSLDAATDGLRVAIGSALYPVIEKIIKLVTEFVAKHRDSLKKWAEGTAEAIDKWVEGGGMERLFETLGRIGDTIGEVVDWLGPMGVAMAGAAVLVAPLVGAVGGLGASFLTLGITALPLLMALPAGLLALTVPIAAFVAAAAGIALAGKAIYDNWDALVWIFKDWGNSLKFAVTDAWNAVQPFLDKLASAMGPFGGLLRAGGKMLVENTLGIGGGSLGAASVAPAASGGVSSTEARVTVDFANAPKGTRVNVDRNSSQPVDVNLGYSSVAP